ncbi:MAG TPA: hypothetical protein VGG74_14600 [Kofleriaceae bacterium]|jgi:hypothetical protein
MRASIGIVVIGASFAPRAIAEPLDLIEPGLPDRSGLPDDAVHLEAGFGIDLGPVAAGTMTAYGGVHGLVGARSSRIALLGELDLSLSLENREDGRLGGFARGAVEARFSLWEGRVATRPRHEVPAIARADLWIEPAIGYELATEASMPGLARHDVSLALGFAESRHAPARWSGGYVALRVIVAPAADGGHEISGLVTSGVVFGS